MRRFPNRTPVPARSALASAFAVAALLASPVASLADGAPADGETASALSYWPAESLAKQRAYESFLDDVPNPERIAKWHVRYAEEPHVAGEPGDRRMIEKLSADLEALGLEVETHRFTAYLPRPVSASLEIVAAGAVTDIDVLRFGDPATELPLALPIKEQELEGDPDTAHPDLFHGWNAYAATGEVTAGVVYVNRGTKEDFERLAELGVDLDGKIALARYGGNFRGYKAKFAQEAGAAGLVIFTDPGDSGYARGDTYPAGGWANGSYIQRGSILTLPYPGDPLTPFEPAHADAERLDPAKVALPEIPVQPIGWGAAFEILRRMDGEPLPEDLRAGWQGGLPLPYRLGGGALRLRLAVEQERRLVETANVLGYLKGETHPDQWVLVGSHHDAWSFGAGDPNAGTMLVQEAARSFAEAAAKGHRPARTMVFAHWGAEEYGIIGSVEWAEARRKDLEKAVAYINLDGAAMGTRFRSSSAPMLKQLVTEVAREIPQAEPDSHGVAGSDSVYDQWVGDGDAPRFGNLGGGSDHVGFYCHLGIPSVGLNAGGSPGVSYHSNYETLGWYRHVVGDDYAGARMLTRMVNRMSARLANGALLPLDPVRYGEDLRGHLADLSERAGDLGHAVEFSRLRAAADVYKEHATETWDALRSAVADGRLQGDALDRANELLLGFEREWLHDPGLPERPWYRNLYAATDPDSGYASWMLPALRWAVERGQLDRVIPTEDIYLAAVDRLELRLTALDELVANAGGAAGAEGSK
ncbi:MAG: M28 family peptidase [Acidobacteriota bacterium]